MSSLLSSLRSGSSSSAPSIRSAVLRAREESVRRHLDNCSLVAAIFSNGLSVRQLEALRGGLPDSASLLIAKKSIVARAVEGTPWEQLSQCGRGMTAWLFVKADEIPPVIKACREFQTKWGLRFNDFTGAVFEGRLYGPDDFEELEKMPTKAEIHQHLIASLHVPMVSMLSLINAEEWGLLPSSSSSTAATESPAAAEA